MELEDVRQIITTKLHDWDITKTDVDVLYVNRKGLDHHNTTRPFVNLNINYGNADTASIDVNPRRRRYGTLSLQCFAPLDTGHRKLTLIADELVSHFEYFRSVDRKVWIGTSDVVDIDNDRFYQININFNFIASDI